MKWPWQDNNNDREPTEDDIFVDTYIEMVLVWIAVCLTFLCIMGIVYYVFR